MKEYKYLLFDLDNTLVDDNKNREYASTVRNRFCNAELVLYAVPKKRLVKKYK